jgi:hypothetical protein
MICTPPIISIEQAINVKPLNGDLFCNFATNNNAAKEKPENVMKLPILIDQRINRYDESTKPSVKFRYRFAKVYSDLP